ncbi:cytochrome P450 monooxygenase [Chaetomium sp. MPI-CAGE-AT-0009]|nr:cytochrome P450 monooxygenase [Chaetomium sp. MPI-CAGE-AT-0009]
MSNSQTLPMAVGLAVAGMTVFLGLLRWFSLPRPIPGIPYIAASSQQVLGDLPAIRQHIADGGTYITYFGRVLETLKTPVAQVFIWPLGKPMVILADFSHGYDILVRREAEFERAVTLANLVKGILPSHHIHHKTNATWKAQRLLIRDLMTPSFLHNVAGPVLHQSATRLIELWRIKARIAGERPFAANKDIYNFALDAVTAFAFGKDFEHSAVQPSIEAIQALGPGEEEKTRRLLGLGGHDDPVVFPQGQLPELLAATIELTDTVVELHGNPLPTLTWAYVMRKPRVARANRLKEDYILGELKAAAAKMMATTTSERVDEATEGSHSAVEHMVARERSLAEKAGRQPSYFSRVMIDEVFGFVYAGHETTSTTLCWGVKFIADHRDAQDQLRAALHSAHAKARSQGRSPTAHEIVSIHVPRLEATIEEMLRCSGTAPSVDREALVDTQILGFHIPKGTIVSQPCAGPGLTRPGLSLAVDEHRRSPSSREARKKGGGVAGTAWGADVSAFRPARWLRELDDGRVEFDPNAGPQLAFGLGTRACWGKRLVYVEARILLTLLVWHFDFLPGPPELSGYGAIMKATNEPRDCFVRLREI